MLKNSMSDIVPEGTNLKGFYRAVVEDNNDPLKINRVRVRIFGLHTDKKEKDEFEGIPTSELPWAEPCLSIMEGSVSGFGMWSVPLQGSHVMLFFENENPQKPMYFASIPGIPTTAPDTSKGFNDPDGGYPKSVRVGESDVHRLARGISDGTIVAYKNSNLDTGVSTALGGTFSEPTSPFASTYPHNTVIATHGGVIIELDSTPSATRFQIYHPSNSYIEIDNDGNMVIKNEKDKYEITLGNRNIHIKQDENVTIDGNKKDKVTGDLEEEVGGDKTIEITGTKDETVTGALTESFDSGQTTDVTGALTITATGVVNITAVGAATITAPTVAIAGGSVTLSTGSQEKLLAGGALDKYNNHVHSQPNTTEDATVQGNTGVPTVLLVEDTDTTTNTQAS